MSEKAISFECHGTPLIGILHKPEQAARRGILFVVGGGPQYRAGGHRQLTLWARRLCNEGYPVFRFDYRGMGDSHGEFRGFLDVDDDISVAIDQFVAEMPELDEIILWGECDASTAIIFYAYRDPRVKGVVLLNPWVRTETGNAKTILRFYYLERIMQPSFWKKLFSGHFNPVTSIKSAIQLIRKARTTSNEPTIEQMDGLTEAIPRSLPLTESLLLGMSRFAGPVMLVLSGRDFIAREFEELISNSPAWQEQFKQKIITRHDIAEADHTFSSAEQRTQVVDLGLNWLRSW